MIRGTLLRQAKSNGWKYLSASMNPPGCGKAGEEDLGERGGRERREGEEGGRERGREGGSEKGGGREKRGRRERMREGVRKGEKGGGRGGGI